jgi:hypothetical protein
VAAKKPLITFYGWDGKWWRRIKVGRAALEASTWIIPLKYQLVYYTARWVGGMVTDGFVRQDTKGR